MSPVILQQSFYRQGDVTEIARALLGKVLVSRHGKRMTSGIIVETEAYSWQERGCHAYGNKMTPRNAAMFEAGGILYIYRCYGIHNLLNVVTGQQGMGEAVLVRALEPIKGLKWMEERTGNSQRVTSGPGKLTKAMGITTDLNGSDLNSSPVWIEDQGITFRQISTGPRIGIDYAGADADLPWRFWVAKNPWVSR